MDEIFIDTDVILDVLLDRMPYSHFSSQIFILAETGKISISTSSLCINNIYYLIRKYKNHKAAIQILSNLCHFIKITSVGSGEIKKALDSNFSDFEDAIQFYTALSKPGTKAILTRNIKDYKNSTLAIFTPESFLKASGI